MLASAARIEEVLGAPVVAVCWLLAVLLRGGGLPGGVVD
jgi:hypothetical protein